ERGASHVHLEPTDSAVVVRLRIDGRCVAVEPLSPEIAGPTLARLVAMADLDTSERGLPQRGKASFRLGERSIELVVDTLPSFDGRENVVLELVRAPALRHLSELALSDPHREKLEALLEARSGLFVVAGPSGAGKTTTLHALVDALVSAEVKICTAEDPVEII